MHTVGLIGALLIYIMISGKVCDICDEKIAKMCEAGQRPELPTVGVVFFSIQAVAFLVGGWEAWGFWGAFGAAILILVSHTRLKTYLNKQYRMGAREEASERAKNP